MAKKRKLDKDLALLVSDKRFFADGRVSWFSEVEDGSTRLRMNEFGHGVTLRGKLGAGVVSPVIDPRDNIPSKDATIIRLYMWSDEPDEKTLFKAVFDKYAFNFVPYFVTLSFPYAFWVKEGTGLPDDCVIMILDCMPIPINSSDLIDLINARKNRKRKLKLLGC